MEKINWADPVKNKKLLHTVNEDGNLRTIKRRRKNSISHILPRNCLLKHIIEGKIEGRVEVYEK
jgi:hypothetical protein